MSNLQQNRELLLELVKCEIWSRDPDLTLFNRGEFDWRELLHLAAQQSLYGVLYNSILKLPKELQPDRTQIFKLHQIVIRNRQQFEHHTQVAAEVMERLQLVGAPSATLLKGLSVSRNYPDPSARMCGDIDIFVGDEAYPQAITIAEGDEFKEDHKHFEFDYKRVSIEIHRFITSSETIIDRGEELVRWLDDALLGGEYNSTMELNGVTIKSPNATFNAIYIFLHAHHHLIRGGIGLRQICDWALILESQRDQIDYEVVERLLKRHNMTKIWNIFIALIINHLGFNPSNYPLTYNAKAKDIELVLDVVLERGNFGQSIDRGAVPKGYLSGQLFKLRYNIREIGFFMKIDLWQGIKLLSKVIFIGLGNTLSQLHFGDKNTHTK